MSRPYGGSMPYGAVQGVYGTTSAADPNGTPYAQKMSFQRKRMNIVAICLSQFVPWLVFSLVFALLSFSWHYRAPQVIKLVTWAIGAMLGALTLYGIASLSRGNSAEDADNRSPTWMTFLFSTTFLALLIASYIGDRNFWLYMQPHYDISYLNTYSQVDPSRMRGQELMDAGAITFVDGTHLDLKRSMGFKNMDVYCVAPITGGYVEGDPPLASYDFWAVGKNCCDPNTGGDFACGEYNSITAQSGLRAVQDEDRAFYRLAVQQAQSAYAIKASHPLFFYWVSDPHSDNDGMKRDGYRFYLIGMVAYFCFQLLLVAGAVRAFVVMF